MKAISRRSFCRKVAGALGLALVFPVEATTHETPQKVTVTIGASESATKIYWRMWRALDDVEAKPSHWC
ncbi:hypothetical protein LCGC14_1717690 [marine sediment metagenome]|uniref:Uncharacterized protein n=1 Tax=marine sediment metagenome TaxID=412755 RepID=A0A0F9HDM4_9ZZZZ